MNKLISIKEAVSRIHDVTLQSENGLNSRPVDEVIVKSRNMNQIGG